MSNAVERRPPHRRKPRRAERGYALAITLALAVTLTIVGATIYLESGDQLLVTKATGGHSIAAARAEAGVQQAIAMLQQNFTDWVPKLSIGAANCTDVPSCLANTPNSIISSGLVNNPNGDLGAAGGAISQYYIFAEFGIAANASASAPVYKIVSYGYYGYQGSPNLITSIVEAEVSFMSLGSSYRPTCYDSTCNLGLVGGGQ